MDSVNSERPEVVGLGAATLDRIWMVQEFSNSETVQVASSQAVMGGGPVATALCVLSRLGHKTCLVDVCGEDATGNQIVQELDCIGVSTSTIQKIVGASSAEAVILVRKSDGARQIVFNPSSAGEPTLDEKAREAVRGARLLHINGRHEKAAREAVREAIRAGVKISFDGGAGRYRESIRDLMEASHIRIVSHEFARQWSGLAETADMLNCLLRPPANVVVITNGANGSDWIDTDRTIHHQPAFAASPLIDTTGCGDVYHGGFLHGLLHGWNLSECASFASRLASRNAEGLGGRYVCQIGK